MIQKRDSQLKTGGKQKTKLVGRGHVCPCSCHVHPSSCTRLRNADYRGMFRPPNGHSTQVLITPASSEEASCWKLSLSFCAYEKLTVSLRAGDLRIMSGLVLKIRKCHIM